MHLVIAIPTLNRRDYLERNIASIDKQEKSSDLKITIAISNSASEDSTEAYLNDLKKKREDISLFNQQTGWSGGNYGHLVSAIPESADWIWYMGDDDYLCDPKSIVNLYNVLMQNQNDNKFVFAHACQARRSSGSGKVICDTVFNLCNRFGYIEMLGWISSLVVRKDFFVSILRAIDNRVQLARDEPKLGQSHSAFFHSAYFLEFLYDKHGAFIDMPLVDPQDDDMTDDTRERWQDENMSERYIYVVDDLARLKKLGVPISKMDVMFFRYHHYHLWDRFMLHQLNVLKAYGSGDRSEVVQVALKRFIKNWERISSIFPLIKDPLAKKQLINVVEMNIGLCNLFIEKNFDEEVRLLISRQLELLSVKVYDFNLLQA